MADPVGTRTHGGLSIVTVAGDVDIDTAAPLREELDRVTDDTSTDVVVDLTQSAFMDSTGMGVLMGALRRLRLAGRTLELAVDDDRVLHVLRITGLADAFVVHRGVEQALIARRSATRAAGAGAAGA